jgi:hypothetical protein
MSALAELRTGYGHEHPGNLATRKWGVASRIPNFREEAEGNE